MRETVRDALWNEESRRLRVPWRFVVFLLVLALTVLVVGLSGFALGDAIEAALYDVWPTAPAILAARQLVSIAVQVVVFVVAIYLTARFVDRRWATDLGFHVDAAWWRDLGFGLALGATLVAGIFLVEYAAGWVVVTDTFHDGGSPFALWQGMALSLALFLAVGLYEELLVRGYLLTNVAEGLTWFERFDDRWAVGLATLATAGLFGVAHAANPNASLASSLGISLAGLMLATGYVLTGELAIPIGVHVTWNFVQGPVLGFPVSGLAPNTSILQIQQGGPALVTGGSFGPEAGLIGVVATVAGIALTVAWVYSRDGHVRIAPTISAPALRDAPE